MNDQQQGRAAERSAAQIEAARVRFEQYVKSLEPGMRNNAPNLKRDEAYAVIAFSLFMACEELQAERDEARIELEQLRAEQPAAAPIDECELCHSSGYMDETLGGALPGVPDAPCMNGCKATEQTAPSPADERAARLDDADIDTIAESMPGGLDSFIKQWGWRQFARAVEDEVILNVARAASANETGAEGAAVAWMSTDDPRDCISDAKKRDMIEHAGAPGARLAEKYSIALGVITPAQADARAGLTDEQREAIEYAITRMDLNVSNRDAYTAAKELRALLNGADHAE
ncbi:hypothetical protein [Burkholderia multivorans]|uniref:hypothetical protein n=1 Tax=Burkholderia multivorans TaxID=87883 RepID=UPI000CFF678C|nr:hypothetical protein [Burkholderia multivorans]PRG40428.1 hypothetical protein C6T62_12740 [Burkholderia multivorans]